MYTKVYKERRVKWKNLKCDNHTKKEEVILENEREKRIWKELAKDGIHSEKELDAAIKNMKLLNIGGFINKIEMKGSESNAN